MRTEIKLCSDGTLLASPHPTSHLISGLEPPKGAGWVRVHGCVRGTFSKCTTIARHTSVPLTGY